MSDETPSQLQCSVMTVCHQLQDYVDSVFESGFVAVTQDAVVLDVGIRMS